MKIIGKIKTNTLTNIKKRIRNGYVIFASLLPQYAFAYDGDTATTIIYNICAFLSGAFGVGFGVLGVIYSGFEMMGGEIEKKSLLIRALAISLIVGGAYMGKQVLMRGMG